MKAGDSMADSLLQELDSLLAGGITTATGGTVLIRLREGVKHVFPWEVVRTCPGGAGSITGHETLAAAILRARQQQQLDDYLANPPY